MVVEQFVGLGKVEEFKERGFKRATLTEKSGEKIDPLVRSRYINAVKRGELIYMVKEKVEDKSEVKADEVEWNHYG